MTPNEYQRMALSKEADQEKIRQRIESHGVFATRLENAFRGLANEVGELSELLKNWLEYGRPITYAEIKTAVLEEGGDFLWRTSQLLAACGWTLEDAMAANLRKLNIRYEAGFTEQEAEPTHRDKSAERAALEGAKPVNDLGEKFTEEVLRKRTELLEQLALSGFTPGEFELVEQHISDPPGIRFYFRKRETATGFNRPEPPLEFGGQARPS